MLPIVITAKKLRQKLNTLNLLSKTQNNLINSIAFKGKIVFFAVKHTKHALTAVATSAALALKNLNHYSNTKKNGLVFSKLNQLIDSKTAQKRSITRDLLN
jgi:hypothetical protein